MRKAVPLLVLLASCAPLRPTVEQLDHMSGPRQMNYCMTESTTYPQVTGAARQRLCACTREVFADTMTRDEATLLILAGVDHPSVYRQSDTEQRLLIAQIKTVYARVDAEIERRCVPK